MDAKKYKNEMEALFHEINTKDRSVSG
jgi:hypothetical protein